MSALAALERAKEIAARLALASNKREREDGGVDPAAKRYQPSPQSAYENAAAQVVTSTQTQYQTLSQNDSSSQPVVISVPNSVVGAIIGRGGESIKNIQSMTGCQLKVERESEMAPGSTTRQITFLGADEQAIAMARNMVERMVSERAGPSSGGGSGGGGGGGMSQAEKLKAALDAGHSSLKVKIPDTDVGLIIGKGGATIKSIQERTGSSIQIPGQADMDDPTVRTCVITHPEKSGCDNAKQLMEDVLMKRGDGAGGAATISMSSGGVTESMMVPDKDIGMVIGRGGSTIKELQRRAGSVRVQIPPQADPGTSYRTCTMTGTKEGCDTARALITRILQEHSTNFLLGDAGGQQQRYAGQYGQQYGQQQYQQPSQQGAQKDYSKEWAAYYAAQAQAQQPQQQPQQQHHHHQEQQQNAQKKPDLSDPKAYYEDFWKYASYYGEEAARKYYGAWSPPVGSKAPASVSAAPQTTQSASTTKVQQTASNPTSNQSAPNGGSADQRDARGETSKRNVSNLPAWMTAQNAA